MAFLEHRNALLYGKSAKMAGPQNISTKAYVVEGKGAPFTLRDVVLDAVQPGEVLVEMEYTGLCHTVGFAVIRD